MARGRAAAAVLLALFLAVGAFWAGRITLQPAVSASELPAQFVTVDVKEQTVGRVLNLNVTVTQAKQALAVNTLSGVVTMVSRSGGKRQGSVLYRVAAKPVRAVQGRQPFYRSMSLGAKGTDVAQLRKALVAMKYLSANGRTFDRATRLAVRDWQRDLGMPRTGGVALGELVAVPNLPGSIVVDAKVLVPGAMLSGGEKVVFAAAGQPEFALVVSPEQSSLVPESATIQMAYQGKKWTALIADSQTTVNGETKLILTSPKGGAVCAKDCALLAGLEEVFILSQVQVVPPASGPAVPVAAITTTPDGSTHVQVVADDGAREIRTVRVLGSQDGVAVVDGVTVGERVQVIGDDPASSEPTPPNPTPTR